MSIFQPRFNTVDWHRLLLKVLGLQKVYHHFIVIEGINTLKILAKKKKNSKLKIFCETKWFALLKTSPNKITCLLNFDEWYNKKHKVMRSNGTKILPKIVKQSFSYSSKLWISIGINNYESTPFDNLTYAVNDSKTLCNFALEKGFRTLHKINEECSKQELEILMQSYLCNRLNPDDLLVISFHGHGYSSNFNDKKYGFIVPYGAKDTSPANMISMELLSLWVQMLPSRHILIILDCCFSGMMALRSTTIPNISPNNTLKRNSLYKNLCKKARIVINAGQEDEAIMDGGWNNNSLLTGLIVSYKKYDETSGSIYSLFNYLSKKIPMLAEQNPTLGKLHGDMGGDIFLTL